MVWVWKVEGGKLSWVELLMGGIELNIKHLELKLQVY
jgi:hypothetical protein